MTWAHDRKVTRDHYQGVGKRGSRGGSQAEGGSGEQTEGVQKTFQGEEGERVVDAEVVPAQQARCHGGRGLDI